MARTHAFLATAIVAFWATTAPAADRALILTISDYATSPLPGAEFDGANARQIVQRLGFGSDNIRALKDRQLTAKGIEDAFAKLVAETQNGDRVFIHFSGHGTSQRVDGRCQESLVAQDLKMVSSQALAGWLQQLKDKASRVVVNIDACHSGGLIQESGTRGVKPGAPSRFRPRFVAAPEGARCDNPTNVVAEVLTSGVRSTRGATLANNYLYIAAARRDEVAYEDSSGGGMSTASLLACLNALVADTDRSGGISVKELVQCAQTRIDQEFAQDPVYRPHHISVSGNMEWPLAAEAAPSAASERANPVATLSDLQAGSDSRWQVRIDAKPPRAKVGKDAFKLSITSSQGGYLYLLYVGSDRKEFLQLYPDKNEPNWIDADRPLRIPGEFAAEGPRGTNHVLALVSRVPRDFSRILGQGSAAATLANAAAIQDITCTTRNLKRKTCQTVEEDAQVQTRNLKVSAVAVGEADSYGAVMVELVEE
ncbi:MAG: hypothetical protein A2040_19900 [Rhodocyclales bacterium GWA2_65_19]|nr:MAG: hypothetical protein A2040_19900 [Rhodocyclales bacterium GWA2_65_19]